MRTPADTQARPPLPLATRLGGFAFAALTLSALLWCAV